MSFIATLVNGERRTFEMLGCTAVSDLLGVVQQAKASKVRSQGKDILIVWAHVVTIEPAS